MPLSLIVVTVFGYIVTVQPVPVSIIDCIAVLPDHRRAIAAQMALRGLDMGDVDVSCVPPGAIVFRGVPA